MRSFVPLAAAVLASSATAAPVFLDGFFARAWKDTVPGQWANRDATEVGPSPDEMKSVEVAVKAPSGTSSASDTKETSAGPSSDALPSPLFIAYDSAADIPDPAALEGYNVFLLTFWGSTSVMSNAAAFAALSPDERAKTHAAYKEKGIKLGVSAFGSLETPVTSGEDPVKTANALAAWVKEMGLDGVDIDFEDFAAMSGGTAPDWIITFQKTLRAALPKPYFISHAPIAPWFSQDQSQFSGGYLKVNEAVGSGIDIMIVQAYNQKQYYADCTTLISKSSYWPGTSILEIAKVVPSKKVVLGKTSSEAATPNGGYMTPEALGKCVAQAKSSGWSGGLMYWAWPEAEGLASQVWGS